MSSHIAVPRPSDVITQLPSKVNTNRAIRDAVKDIVVHDDDFFDAVCEYMLPPGKAGNRQMDQAIAAEMFFRKVPILASYKGLNHKLLWAHVVHVMGGLGYKLSGGYVTGHLLEDMSDQDVDAA